MCTVTCTHIELLSRLIFHSFQVVLLLRRSVLPHTHTLQHTFIFFSSGFHIRSWHTIYTVLAYIRLNTLLYVPCTLARSSQAIYIRKRSYICQDFHVCLCARACVGRIFTFWSFMQFQQKCGRRCLNAVTRTHQMDKMVSHPHTRTFKCGCVEICRNLIK